LKYDLVLKNGLIFCCLIGMLWWFYVQSQSSNPVPTRAKPQEYMSFLTITNYSEVGRPKEKLQADYWEFIPNHGRSDLSNPFVTIYKDNGNVWLLSAKKALAWHPTIGDRITQLDMVENVVIERTADNGATPTKVATQAMQYFPSKGLISSSEYVSMQQPGLLISGYGLSGYLDKNRIELHDNITTVYHQNAS